MVKSSKVRVLLDTNFLTLPQQFHVDIVEEIKFQIPSAELATISPVIDELRELPTGGVGLELIRKGLVKTIPATGKADDALLERALGDHAVVCTNDKELRKRLRSAGVPVMYLRGRKKLQLDGVVE
ncbi:MAG: hypothetical protein J7L23_00135 [Candidatus Diapherotrites archaeon]|nr:hypothetical protein [Candidatus Diapherotrites archaeon]